VNDAHELRLLSTHPILDTMRNLLFVSLLAVPLVSCVAAGGAAVGVVASSQLMDNHAYVSRVDQDASVVWDASKKFLSEQSKELIQYDDASRTATAKIDGADVRVAVETWDIDKCTLTVTAKKFLATVNDGEMAKIVMERLLRRIQGS
jgi:hypothetical protein